MQFPARLPRPVLDFILKVKMSLMMKGGEKRRKEMNITNPSKARFTAGTTGKYRPRPNRFPNIANFRLPVNQVTRIHFDTVSKDLQAINRRSLWFLFDASDPISTEIDQE